MKSKINVRFIIISALAIVLTTVTTTLVYYRIFQKEVMAELSAYAVILESTVYAQELSADRLNLPERNIRITLVQSDGTVLYDDSADIEKMDNHGSRPEIVQALKKGEGQTIRNSATIHKSNYYYAKKMRDGNVIRVSKETDSIWSHYCSVFPIVILIGVLLLLLCFVIAHHLTRSLLKPIEQMVDNMDHLERVESYKELEPFIQVIRTQHEDILKGALMRQEFTANVTHELKTPLTSISGYAELIENGMAKKTDIQRFAGEIRSSANRLLSLINDIIQLSELDSTSEREVAMEEIDLFELAENCVNMLEPVAAKHGVSLHLSGNRSLTAANRDMMEEMIYNLCDNAIRYNTEGGNVWIEVGKSLVIRDDGIGISPENQERIFERFFRVDKSRSAKTGGTGLGLAIVKHIIEIHNGSIRLSSEEQTGTTIEVSFMDIS